MKHGDMSVSLDGYVAGSNQSVDVPFGEGVNGASCVMYMTWGSGHQEPADWEKGPFSHQAVFQER
jgi:hypothetical protein